MGKVRVGFIGVGQIAELHARGYVDNPSGELVAVADIDPAVAEARAAEWGIEEWYTDYRELLADPAIDAVEILLPHHLHLPVALEALEAGAIGEPLSIRVKTVSGRGAHEFTRAIQDGTQPDLDGLEARHALAFCLAVMRSALDRREVALADR